MATRDKRLDSMRQNPRNVRPEHLAAVLQDHGFHERHGSGSHHTFSHPKLPDVVTVPFHHPVKPVYVRKAIAAIEALPEEEEEK